MKARLFIALAILLSTSLFACSRHPDFEVLRRFPLEDISEVITRKSVSIDERIVSHGKGSLRISAAVPVVVKLFETGPLDIDDARLVYQARLRAEGFKGKAYLEMLVDFVDGKQYFSRGFNSPITEDVGWTTESVPFFLEKGQRPQNVKLNLVIDGTGVVWVDDVQLIKAPL